LPAKKAGGNGAEFAFDRQKRLLQLKLTKPAYFGFAQWLYLRSVYS